MSLLVYTNRNEIPDDVQYIDYNDKFFGMTELKDDAITLEILEKIDYAEYHSPTTFIGRDKELGALNKSNLSTGCKTLLNIVAHPEKCFSVIECGHNALKLLAKITNGRIYWNCPSLFLEETEKCDISIRGKEFKDFMEFAHYIMDIMPEED